MMTAGPALLVMGLEHSLKSDYWILESKGGSVRRISDASWLVSGSSVVERVALVVRQVP